MTTAIVANFPCFTSPPFKCPLLIIPILHDAFQAATHVVLQYSENGARQSKENEKRNNELGDTGKVNGTRPSRFTPLIRIQQF